MQRGICVESVVSDPILRENTKDNTRVLFIMELFRENRLEITVAPKGFGSENMSRVFMLKPADGIEGVQTGSYPGSKRGRSKCLSSYGNWCAELAALLKNALFLAKKALTRELGSHSEIPYVKDFEIEVLEAINKSWNWSGWIRRPCYSNRIKCRNLSDTYCRTSGCRKHLLSCKSPHYKSVIKRRRFSWINILRHH